ncbi:MAG: hypothetical protein FJ386_08200 [Verrucomicrobia bacterium]|nr:hypothetical protein [Verrucomicrobiota bacterium]
MHTLRFVLTPTLALSFALALHAQDKQDAPKAAPDAAKKEAPVKAKPRATTTKWDLTDLGQFFSSGLEMNAPDGKGRVRPALKALSIRVGANDEATVCFDTERLRWAAAWTGGFLKLPTGREGLEGVPQPAGELAFSSTVTPGWAFASGGFDEPNPPKREGNELISFGPLPREWAKWRGFYLHDKQVILSYTVGKASVLEMPGYDAARNAFTRTFHIENSDRPMTMLLFDVSATPGAKAVAAAITPGMDSALDAANGRSVLKLPPLGRSATFRVAVSIGDDPNHANARAAAGVAKDLPDLKALTRGGPARWNPILETKGETGSGGAAYVVDTLTLPEDNPWQSWLRTSGFDFFKDATRAAICTVNGEVWLVSGIDEKLERLRWKRFATGLFQPLGLKIVDEKIYVLGRDQLTRLHDLNNDGEADFYENFNNDVAISSHYHEFCLNLETDPQGNFYFTKGGNLGPSRHPHHGALLRISKDGSKLDVVATGLRAPNGMGVGPRGEITTADNEGNWVPSSRVDLVRPGGFLGHIFTSHDTRVAVLGTNATLFSNGKSVESFPAASDKFKAAAAKHPVNYDKPILWLPHTYDTDNSSGGQVWVTSDKWGPFSGDLLHLSYGACALHKVMLETVGGQVQGGAFKFPLKFKTGIMRGRFSPLDGQLYLTGLVVWQSNGAQKGALHRVRYTGKPANLPSEMRVRPNGIEITFTDPLDKSLAEDSGSYAVEQWNYQWTTQYGSKDWSVENPSKMGRDPRDVKSAKLQPDGRTVFLDLGPMQPVMQMQVKLNLKTAAGATISQTIFNTINSVPAK